MRRATPWPPRASAPPTHDPTPTACPHDRDDRRATPPRASRRSRPGPGGRAKAPAVHPGPVARRGALPQPPGRAAEARPRRPADAAGPHRGSVLPEDLYPHPRRLHRGGGPAGRHGGYLRAERSANHHGRNARRHRPGPGRLPGRAGDAHQRGRGRNADLRGAPRDVGGQRTVQRRAPHPGPHRPRHPARALRPAGGAVGALLRRGEQDGRRPGPGPVPDPRDAAGAGHPGRLRDGPRQDGRRARWRRSTARGWRKRTTPARCPGRWTWSTPAAGRRWG